MGYESRLIVAKKFSTDSAFAETLAELNMCKVGGDFLNLFTDEYEGDFYDFYAHSDDPVKKDCYGKPLTYAPFERVYTWLLDNAMVEHYRRYDMLLGLLNAVRMGWSKDEMENFIIIHYGY